MIWGAGRGFSIGSENNSKPTISRPRSSTNFEARWSTSKSGCPMPVWSCATMSTVPRNLVDALGPAPKEGEPPESGEIISKRETLNEKLAADTGRLKQLDVLIQQGREYLSQISDAESAALDEQLLTRTPSVLSPETWREAAEDISALSGRARGGFDRWRKSEAVKDARSGGFAFGALLAVLAVAVLAFFLRGWLFRTYGRRSDIEQPSYRRRALASLVEAAARTAIPTLVAVAIYVALYISGVLFGFAKEVALGAVTAVVAVSIIYGLPRAMLSPSQPHWRLVAIGDSAAKLWYRYAVTLAGLVGLDILLSMPVADLMPGEALSNRLRSVHQRRLCDRVLVLGNRPAAVADAGTGSSRNRIASGASAGHDS